MRPETREKKLQELIKIGFKICSKCGIRKPVDRFPFEKKRQYYSSECKDCLRIRIRKKLNQKSNEEENQLRRERARQKADEILKNGSKKCNRCGKEKELKDFVKQKSGGSFDGYQNTCKQCTKIYWKKPNGSPLLPEKMRDLIFIVKKKTFKTVLTEKERGEKKKKTKTYRYWHDDKYRERCKQKARDDHKKDRSKMLARKHKREALMIHQDDGTITVKEIKRILEERKTCPYCGEPIGKPELDHMDPISKGGLHSISNIVGCCHKCNSKKHTKSFVEWLSFIKVERRDYAIRFYERKHGARPEQGLLPFKYAA